MAGMGGGCHRSLNAKATPILFESNPGNGLLAKVGPSLEMAEHALENQPAVILAEDVFAGPLGVGHHAADVPAFVANAGDVE